jgi:hypothetical protein
VKLVEDTQHRHVATLFVCELDGSLIVAFERLPRNSKAVAVKQRVPVSVESYAWVALEAVGVVEVVIPSHNLNFYGFFDWSYVTGLSAPRL